MTVRNKTDSIAGMTFTSADLLVWILITAGSILIMNYVGVCIKSLHPMNYHWAQRKCREFEELVRRADSQAELGNAEEAKRLMDKAHVIQQNAEGYGWRFVEEEVGIYRAQK